MRGIELGEEEIGGNVPIGIKLALCASPMNSAPTDIKPVLILTKNKSITSGRMLYLFLTCDVRFGIRKRKRMMLTIAVSV